MITILGAGGAIGNELVKLLAATNQPFRLVGRNPKATPCATEILAVDLIRGHNGSDRASHQSAEIDGVRRSGSLQQARSAAAGQADQTQVSERGRAVKATILILVILLQVATAAQDGPTDPTDVSGVLDSPGSTTQQSAPPAVEKK